MSGSSDGNSDLRCDLEKLFLMFCWFSVAVRLQLDMNTLVFPRNMAQFNDVENWDDIWQGKGGGASDSGHTTVLQEFQNLSINSRRSSIIPNEGQTDSTSALMEFSLI